MCKEKDGNYKYTAEQVKVIALSFYNSFPPNPSVHTESVYDAWFERYGDKVANRDYHIQIK